MRLGKPGVYGTYVAKVGNVTRRLHGPVIPRHWLATCHEIMATLVSFATPYRTALLWSLHMPLVEYATTKLPVYDVDLAAPPAERWKAVCVAEGDNIAALLADVVDECLEYVNCLPAYLQPFVTATAWGGGSLAGWIVDRIAGMFGEDYVAEIRGIARHAELPLGHIVLGNLIYDICQISGIPGVGCSSFSVTLDGKPTLARNMDWVFPASTGLHSRLIRFHKGARYYESVSVLGCVGVVSAYCPGEWAITLNQAPSEGLGTNWFQWPTLQRLRKVCDGFGDYRSIVRRVQEYETMSPFFAHVVGVQPNEQTVVAGLGSDFCRTKVRRLGDTTAPLVQTNHYLHDDLDDLNPSREPWKEDGTTYYWDTYPRHASLARRLATPPRTLEQVVRKLRGYPVTTDDTQHQMVFQPNTGFSRVWIRQ